MSASGAANALSRIIQQVKSRFCQCVIALSMHFEA